MIQRIQSLFLLLAALLAAGAAFLPQANIESAQTTGMLSDGRLDGQDHLALLLLFAGAALVAFLTIFVFKNRKWQQRLIGLYLILLLAGIGLAVYLLIGVLQIDLADLLPGPGLFLAIGGIVCAFLARRFIRKDDKLVRSMDRLR